LTRLKGFIAQDFSIDLESTTVEEWRSTTKEIDIFLRGFDCHKRISSFNRTYSLMRGLMAGLLILSVLMTAINFTLWPWGLLVICFCVLAATRMCRFGLYYGRELLLAYIIQKEAALRLLSV
jgi:hypothetical protein